MVGETGVEVRKKVEISMAVAMIEIEETLESVANTKVAEGDHHRHLLSRIGEEKSGNTMTTIVRDRGIDLLNHQERRSLLLKKKQNRIVKSNSKD